MESALRKIQDRIQQNFQLKKIGGGAKFFSSTRRGEGQELAGDLNSTDKDRQKNAVKRIIANMTLGRDVSQLFVDVVKLGQTLNIELKKLVYLYVLNTAKLQPEKALMAVNTFLQDATHASSIIRALAIRTMMCIRVDCVTEYTLEPLRRAVTDVDPYVRKTAAIGIGKLFHQNAKLFIEQNFTAELVRLLSDTFPIVSSNAAIVLSEVNTFGSGPVEVKQEWANQLLTALPECSEWGQAYVLELLASYKPPTAEAAETLLARVVPRLAHTNAAVVMGAVKIVAAHAPRCVNVDVMALYAPRVNAALLTLVKGDPETQYVVCKNVHLLLALFPTLLKDNLDYFFIRFSDPPYVKLEKLKLMLKLTTAANAPLVVKELTVYSGEVDLSFVKEVVAAIAAVANKVEPVAPQCVSLLLQLLDRRPELLPQVITASKNIVRKYPELLFLDSLLRDHGAENVVDEDAKVSLVWMLGEFCDFVESGPSILQQFIESLMSQEQSVQLALLTAVVKVFLRNPKGMEGTLNYVLETLTNHCTDPDVRDRAFSYWRLLSKGIGVENMKKIVHSRKPPIDVDRTVSESMTVAEMRLAINTAAAVYGKPHRTFLQSYGGGELEGNDSDEDEDYDSPTTVNTPAEAHVSSPAPVPSAPPPPAKKFVDPLDDIFGGPIQQAPAAVPTVEPTRSVAPINKPTQGSTAFDDIFGTPSQPTTASPASASPVASKLPPLVCPSATTGGVAYHAELVAAVDGSAPLKLRFAIVNHSPSKVSDFVMQLNTNSFAFVLSAALSDLLKSPFVAPQQSVVVDIPLKVADSHFAAGKHSLEIALKCSLGLHFFSVAVTTPSQLFVTPVAIDKQGFLQLWKALDESCEAKMLIGEVAATMATLPTEEVKRRLQECHCVVVAERATADGRQNSYYGATKSHVGISVLFEIVVSKDASVSYVCCKSQRVNDVLPTVHYMITQLFKKPEASLSSMLF